MTHTWVGDVNARLIAPNGTTFIVFGNVGGGTTGAGDSSNLGGTYVFNDAATGNLWTAATGGGDAFVIPGGNYRTSTNTSPNAFTLMNPSFASIPSSNGTWTLRFTDRCNLDTGEVTAASLTITGATQPPVDFQAPNVDMDGDGESDYVINRGTAPGVASATGEAKQNSVRERLRERFYAPKKMAPTVSPMEWWTITSNGTILGAASWGDADTDWPISADFDGDDQDDFAVWRPETEFNSGAFYWVNSSNNTVGIDSFGQVGDDPTVVGDWDGDGKDDRATYRCPLPGAGDGTCYFYYRTSGDPGNTGYNPLAWGVGELFDFVACPADYDGDGKTDACIQRENPNVPGSGQFVIRNSGNGSVNFIDFGTPDDVVLPGDYDGDGKSDIAVRRNEGPAGNQHFMHYVRLSGGGFTGGIWGYATDVSTPGDYDGDGKQDFAIWRPSTGTFWVARSTDGGFSAVQWGVASDNPLANWYVR